MMLERLLRVVEYDDFDATVRSCVQDRLVPGCAQMWFRYVPKFETVQIPATVDPATGQETPATTFDKLVHEEVLTDYVFWRDFLWSPARTWNEVRWVARKIKLSRMDATARFGDQLANQLTYTKGLLGDSGSVAQSTDQHSTVHYATIYEIWCKRTRTVYWVSKGFGLLLDKRSDPFQGALKDFFPCPKPLLALTSTSAVIPRSDYLMIQDQYEELDRVNHRITQLERAIKVVGAYDNNNRELARIFEENVDNTMIGVQNFSQFSEKGGFKGSMDFVPIEMIVNALEKLRVVRQDLVSQIYELTGISDIMRGASKASETLGAQELKAQYGAVRLQYLQMEVASFVQDGLQIRSKIQTKLFQPQTILMRTNISSTPDAGLAQQAIQLIKDPTFNYRVQVHADTMAVPEFNAERDGRLGYIRAIAEFFTSMAPIVAAEPSAAPFLLKLASWAAASFRTGREVEGVFDQFIKAAEERVKNPPPPPPIAPLDEAKTKLTHAQAVKTTAEAIGQTIENKFTAANPQEVLGQPPKSEDGPPSPP
jgi:hypothetical protein